MSLNSNGYALDKITEIHGKQFKTPTMMITYSFRDNNPRPWKKIDGISVMTNAYDIFKQNTLYKRIIKNGIHKELELTDEICAMDSGGFQFISRGEDEKISAEKVIKLQNASNTDIAVCLDYPLLSKHSPTEAINLTKKSINNIKLATTKIKNNIEVMPVIHGTTVDEVLTFSEKIKKISDFKIWGIGGLVPQMKQKSTSHKRYFNIIDRVFAARKKINELGNEKLLHVFGVGSPLAGLLFLLCGADSIESISWIMNAKYFLVYQDKIGARKVSKKTTMCTTSIRWENYDCQCPICKGLSREEIEAKMKKRGNEGFQNRAMHNAYVYQDILSEAREAIFENRLVELCKDKLSHHRFFKGILKYTLEKIGIC
ncbi:MAG: tRNA-guanine transglycosylase [Asgard group archaeon]|nr:tRNA-guanine transglycosylase [Asgard group archaeon]